MNEKIDIELEQAIRAMQISDEAMSRTIKSIKEMLNTVMDEMQLAIHAQKQAIEAALKAKNINKQDK